MKFSKGRNLPVAILAVAIALSPSFSAGEIAGGRVIEIKAEDIILLVFGFLWLLSIFAFEGTGFNRPPLFLPVLGWLYISLISVLLNLVLKNILISRSFFYFLKEVEFFFMYFYIVYHIRSLRSAQLVIGLWVFLASVNVVWVIYKVQRGTRSSLEYGAGAIGDSAVFPSGVFFLLLFIFLFSVFLHYYLNTSISILKKIILGTLTISPAIGVLASGSRTSISGLVLALLLISLLYLVNKGVLRSVLVFVLTSVLIGAISLLVYQKLPRAVGRISDFEHNIYSIQSTRFDRIWKPQLLTLSEHWPSLFLGLGKSYSTLESHSQYIRNLLETGLIGSLAFFVLIYTVVRKALYGYLLHKDPFLNGLSSGLLVATLVMLIVSIPGEAFLVVKIAETYWFFVAITLAALEIHNEHEAV